MEHSERVETGHIGAGTTRPLEAIEVFAGLAPEEIDMIGAAAPMQSFAAGELLYLPTEPTQRLFILKAGRVRTFRLSTDGRTLTTGLFAPGTIFGEMSLVGQSIESFAEALDPVTVCVMGRQDVERLLLADPRIAARITELLGRRVAELERRLSDTVFKSVPQRIATTLTLLAREAEVPRAGGGIPVALTHEQIAALVGTSRETATKVLGDYAERGLLRLGRGRLVILDPRALAAEAGQ